MLKLEGGWVSQNQFEPCLNLEIRTKKMDHPLETIQSIFFSKTLVNLLRSREIMHLVNFKRPSPEKKIKMLLHGKYKFIFNFLFTPPDH